jgi:hypothetical protein
MLLVQNNIYSLVKPIIIIIKICIHLIKKVITKLVELLNFFRSLYFFNALFF